ncbi:MAG: putative enoyl-CoA hydratase echA8 [Smithella sp. PtaU1.Bin162]|nr:MAG: putative enoyl-CoA hydratase echA8 [Smithella sp. PtaU1.Bin162]
MTYNNLLFESGEGIATVTFNRPKALNAMNPETARELKDVITKCINDENIKVVILTGAGDKAFVAGADIVTMQNNQPSQSLPFMEQGHEVMRLIETMPKIAIAAVNGFALGGGTEISLACDIRFASENAKFGLPEILLGIIPGWGGTQRLPRLVGMGIAKEMILSGTQIDAKRAYEIGLVNRVCPAAELLAEVRKFALKLVSLPPFAVKMAKYSMNFGYDLALDNATRLEIQCCAQCFSTKDQKEGMKAFLEKRKAVFVGQ